MKLLNSLYLFFVIALLGACSSTDVAPADGTEGAGTGEDNPVIASGINGTYEGGGSYTPGSANSPYANATNSNARNGDFYNNAQYGQGVVGGPSSPAKDRVIYFSYDSSNIDSRAEAIIRAHSAFLMKNPNVKILLEGHTDSRGSRGYNISLGERRAIAVMRKFLALGVKPAQIRVVSYGEEQPSVNGYNEDAYRRNRRAVIQY